MLTQSRRYAPACESRAVSGLTNADARERELVVDAFIGKPFDVDHLLRTVKRRVHPQVRS